MDIGFYWELFAPLSPALGILVMGFLAYGAIVVAYEMLSKANEVRNGREAVDKLEQSA